MKEHVSAYRAARLRKKEKEPKHVSAYLATKQNRGSDVGYMAKRAGIDFLRVGEGVVDAALVPVDLLTGNAERAKSRFMDSPVDAMRERLDEEYNPGKVAGFIGDIAGGMGQSVGYGLISAIPYAGKPMMYSSIIEQSISSAAEKTGEVGWKEIGYGATAGAVEGILESKLGAGVNAAKGIGSAILKKTGINVAESAAKAGGKSLLKTLAIDTAKGFAGEFGEEFISEAVDPKLQNIWGIDKDARFSFKDSFRAGIVGGVSGGAISIGPSAINYRSAVSVGRAIQESRLDGDLINRAKYTLSALEAAQTRSTGQIKGKPEGDTKETAKEWLSRTSENRKVKRLSKETAQLADKIRRNIQAYENSMKDPAMAQSEPVAALLGELRGNLFLVGYAYEADVIEQVMMEADDKQRQAFVDAINEELAAQGKKHDYTLADFDANKDDIRRGLAGRLMMDELLGNTAEGGAEATQKPVEPAQAPKDTTAEEVTAQEENAATEATEAAEHDPWESIEEIEGFGTQNAKEEALLRAASSQGVPKKTIPAMLNSFREGTDLTPAEFADAWADGVMFFGRLGLNEKTVSEGSNLARMTEKARKAAINEGHVIADEELKRAKEKAEKKKMPARNEADAKRKQEGRGDIIKGKGLIVQDLDPAQFAAYKAAETFAAVLGTDIVIETDLKTDTGKQINGFYSTKTNRMHININAKRDGKSIALYTLGHEVSHYIKEWSPEKFKSLSDFVLNQLGDKAPDLIADKAEFLRKMSDYKDYTVTQLNDLAVEEVVADSMELVLSDGKILDELARTEKTVWQKIKDFITKIIADIRKYYGELNQASKTAQVLKETMDSLDEIEQLFYEGVTEAGERARTAGVETVTRMNEENMHVSIVYKTADENKDNSIKDQLRTHSSQLEEMAAVDTVNYSPMNKKQLHEKVSDKFKSIGYKVERRNFGIIEIGEKQIDKSINYINTEGEKAALIAIPSVLKRGIVVDGHDNHKNRDYDTITIAAPIEVNGTRGIVGAVVTKIEGKNKYRVHRILTPDGSEFVFETKRKDTAPTSGEPLSNDKHAPIGSASKHSITQPDESVNSKFSISEEKSSDTAYLAAVERGDMEKAQKMVDEAAKKAGYTVKAYHGTNNDFTSFSRNKIMSNTGKSFYGHGFYFSTSEFDAKNYGKKVMPVYLRTGNTLNLDGDSWTYDLGIEKKKSKIEVEKTHIEKAPRGFINIHYTTKDAPNVWKSISNVSPMQIIGDTTGKTFVEKKINPESSVLPRDIKNLAELARNGGYNSIKGGGTNIGDIGVEYVIFDEKNIKSADPVTYDDNGNVIPLSERFKEDNPDIRYSIDETPETPDVSDSATTDRDLLLAMAEKLVGSEEENRILTNYKSHYDTQKARQARLDELTAEMQEQQSTMMYGESAEKRSAAAKRLPAIYKEMSKISEQLADADRKLTEIEGMKAIRNLLKREYAKAREIQKNIYDARYQRKKEGDETTELRRQTRRIYNRLYRMLAHPTKTKNVPYEMQGITAEALKAANMDLDALERLEQLEEQLTKLEREGVPDPEKIAKKEQEIKAQEKQVGSMKEQIQMLVEIFEKSKEIKTGAGANVYSDEEMDILKDLQTKIGNASIRNANREQLADLKKFYDTLYTRISNANKAFATERAASIDEMSTEANTQVKNAKELKVLSPSSREWAALAGVRSFLWKNMKPLTVFEAIGSDKLMEIFRRVLDAEDVWITDILEAKKALDEAKKEFGYNKWNLKERREVTTADGSKVSLTLGEMMSLYAYMFREQAEEHLSAGGFVFAPDAKAIEKFKGSKALYETHLNDQTPHRMRPEDIAKMSALLTEEQRAYAKEVQEYLTSLGAKGNEVSRKLYGIDLFKETAYFPIKSSHDYIETQTGKSGDPNIKSRGTFKETVPRAGNPIVLEDFMEVVGNHVNTMATYHAFVLPVEDLTRVWNYTPVNIKRDADGKAILDENGMPVADTEGEAGYNSLKAEITKKYGKEANDYILQLLRDLNGGARRESAASILDKGLTAFKRSATMLSLSTIVQQPTSIIRAMAYVDAKHFTGASFVPWETVKKYAPVAAIKEMSGFDTGTGARTAEYINAKQYDSIKDAAKAAVTPEIYGGDPNVRAEAFGWLTGKADEVSWRYLFGAIVNEQVEKLGKAKDSEEVLKAAGERFAEVVRRTQVYDSTLTRSEYMRSKDGLMKMATAFGAEPTTVVSMAVDAIIKAERGDKTFLRKSAAGIAFSIIANAAVASLIYAMRDDDEDETIPEKYVQSLTSELIEGFNPLEYLPIARDIMSMFKGYEIERSDMALIGNLMEQVELITSSKRSVPDKIFGVTGAVSAFFGLPVTNVYRDLKGLVKTGQSFTDAEEQTGAGFGFAMGDAVSGQFNLFAKLFGAESGNAYELYSSYVKGDTAHYERVKARYKTDKDAEMALRTELRDNDKRINQAAWAKHTGDLEVYESLVDQIESEGIFDRNIVIRAVNNEASEIKREIEKDNLVPKDETATDDEETTESLYKTSDLNNALERGDTDDFAAIMAALVQDKVSTGKTEAQAKASVKSSITSYWKKQYLSGYQDTETRKRIIAILTETGLYGSRNDVATMCEGWVKNSK